MDQPPETQGLPPGLRFLKALVIVLTLTMIVGVITVVAVLVTRIPSTFGSGAPRLPEDIALPEGMTAQALTLGQGWFAVVARDGAGADHILIYAPDGRMRQSVPVAP